MTIKAVLFDFDGVIAQTETFKLSQLMKKFDELNISYTMQQIFSLTGTIGSEVKMIMNELFKNDFNFMQHKDELLSFHAEYPELITIKTIHLDELLVELRNRKIKIAVASNSSSIRLKAALETLKIFQYFDLIASATDMGYLKPDPYVYLNSMNVLQVTGNETIVIEDSRMGIIAGKKAGAYVVALKDEYGAINQKEADKVVIDIMKIIEIIDTLNNL